MNTKLDLEIISACECCPHISQADLERDEFLREVWDICPRSQCLSAACPACLAEVDYVACSGCGLRNYETDDRLWNCPDFPKCRATSFGRG